MKKLLIIIPVLIFALIMSGCDLLNNIICNHEFEVSTVNATCIQDGYELQTCKKCDFQKQSKTLPKLGHNFGEWTIINEATQELDGLKERTCARCEFVEEVAMTFYSFADLTIIQEPFDENVEYELDTYEDLSKKFQAAILNQAPKLNCEVNFEFDDSLLQKLMDDCELNFAFGVNASFLHKHLTFTFTHQKEPTNKFDIIHYTQLDSVNYTPSNSTRTADYDDFNINDSNSTFKVNTTDQLYYALERGVKPICVSQSTAELAYNQMKKILRNIVDDNMSDFQKVLAIHDYIIMNVTYDNEVYKKIGVKDFDFESYKSFYLEGVLFDKLAVCEGISKAFTSMCNIEGIPCVTVIGYQTQNPNGAGHAWNKVYVDGKWYIIDVTSDGTIVGNDEVLSYKFCLIDENSYSNKYTGETFTNIKCLDDYNVYKYLNFNFNLQTHDYLINSQQELNALIGYWKTVDKADISLEFKVNFNCGASVTDEVQQAYQYNGISQSFSYSDDGDVFRIYK